MITTTKMLALTLATISSLGVTTLPTFAKEITAEEAARRVNLAGRQRMLSQRIAMSACLATVGVDSDINYAKLEDAYTEFSLVHDGLINGNADMGLHQEGYRSVIEAMEAVDAGWSDYQEMIHGIMQIKMMSPDIMTRFDQNGLAVLTDMNVAVTTIAAKYSADLDELPQILAVTIDFAGRERMLTQKMVKEYCLVSAGIDVEANREKLMQSHEQFNGTLAALVDGIPGMITPAPTPEILAKLREVEQVWEQPNAIIEKAIAGEEMTIEDRTYLANNIDIVLTTMNEAVKLYEKVDGLPNF